MQPFRVVEPDASSLFSNASLGKLTKMAPCAAPDNASQCTQSCASAATEPTPIPDSKDSCSYIIQHAGHKTIPADAIKTPSPEEVITTTHMWPSVPSHYFLQDTKVTKDTPSDEHERDESLLDEYDTPTSDDTTPTDGCPSLEETAHAHALQDKSKSYVHHQQQEHDARPVTHGVYKGFSFFSYNT